MHFYSDIKINLGTYIVVNTTMFPYLPITNQSAIALYYVMVSCKDVMNFYMIP